VGIHAKKTAGLDRARELLRTLPPEGTGKIGFYGIAGPVGARAHCRVSTVLNKPVAAAVTFLRKFAAVNDSKQSEF
jgi:hypothetical protein